MGQAPGAVGSVGFEKPCSDALEVIGPIIERLQRPPTLTERYPFLVPFARLWMSDPECHRTAIEELAKARAVQAVPSLVAAVGDESFPYRTEAARALGMIPDSTAASTLLASMSDPDADLRRAAATAVASLTRAGVLDGATEARAISDLTNLLRSDPDPLVRYEAYAGLLETGRENAFFTALVAAEADTHFLLRCAYARDRGYFAFLSTDKTVVHDAQETLRAVFAQPDPPDVRAGARRAIAVSRYPCVSIRAAAAKGLGLLRDASAVAPLAQALDSDPDGVVRAAAAAALGDIGGATAATALIEGLQDPLVAVRAAAMAALVKTGDSRASSSLVMFLAEGAIADRLNAALAFRSLDTPIPTPLLVDALAHPSVQVRRAARAALLSRQERAIIKELIRALSMADERRRRESAHVLALHEASEARVQLVEVLLRAESPSASLAALSLGLRAEPESREALESALLDPRFPMPIAVIHALQDLGQPTSVMALRAYLAGTPPSPTREAAELAAVVLKRKR